MRKEIIVVLLIIFFGCSKSNQDELISTPGIDVIAEEVVVYDVGKFNESYLLAIENGGKSSYLLNKEGKKLYTWSFDDNLGNDIELLENGELLGIFKVVDRPFTFGGGSGKVKLFNSDGSLKWEYTLANNNFLAHHDVEMLPNGNILLLVWERITASEAQKSGVNTNVDIFPEKLIEVNPNTNQVVWEWRSWDRLIQDTNISLSSYGVIKDNPQKIDFNYNIINTNGDIMHANGIDYDAEKDVIHMSVNFYSEIWVIDHSTSTEEAVSDLGGNYNKGGDLIFRYGNPSTYKNTKGTRLFFNNHFPNLLEGNTLGNGNMLIFVNRYNDLDQSIVYELELPQDFNLMPDSNNEPSIVWSFTDTELYSGKFSGAVRLANGNTMICEGDYGYWEVSKNGEVVWKYQSDGIIFWRGYNYEKNSPALSNLNF